MDNKLPRFPKAPALVFGAASLTLMWLPGAVQAQEMPTQPKQMNTQDARNDDITRRDLARFDQFLDSHRDVAEQLRRTPSLIDDPQFLQSHPELNTYLQDHPSVKQEISQHPGTFMRLEDDYNRDRSMRDRDAGGQDRDAGRRDAANDRDAGGQDRDRRDGASFDRFLDSHREIAQQVRKDPSLLDNRNFVQDHPALESYLRDNPGVRDQIRQDPNGFMRQEDQYGRDATMGDRDASGQNRDANRNDAERNNVANDRDADGHDRDRRDVASFDRFLDSHREIAEQVRKDPSLLDNRNFVQNHPVLQAYLEDNPGVRDQLRQDPNGFMRREDNDRDASMRDRDPMHDRMADFGGFLGSHAEIQRDLARDPSRVKDRDYVQNHAELNDYLNAHPEVRNALMAHPESFVQGAQQFNNGGAQGGAGVNGRGAGMTGAAGMTGSSTGTGSSATGTSGASANAAAPSHTPKPNQ